MIEYNGRAAMSLGLCPRYMSGMLHDLEVLVE